MDVTAQRIRELFEYDAGTGIFRRRIDFARNAKAGNVANRVVKGQGCICIGRKTYPASRMAWLYVYGVFPAHQLLHLNGNSADDRISNLREMGNPAKRGGITQEHLKELLAYDVLTGEFVWRICPAKNIRAGSVAGRREGRYRMISVEGVSYTDARLAWLYVHGTLPTGPMRFQNGDAKDCRIENLAEGKYLSTKFDHSTKEGRTAYNRAHRAEHPEHYKDKELRRDFGISLERYREMLRVQNGVCAICGEPERELRRGKLRVLCVDHHHGSGDVRGLLCMSCNKAIGLLRERQDLFEKAADYLRRHQLNST